MNFYIIGIIIFSIILIVCTSLLIYYIKDEKKIKEVSDNDLKKIGKTYSKKEFEDRMFNQYSNILISIQDSNYNFLKDAVSDEVYNKILMSIKNDQERKQKTIIENIKKEFSKLISFEIIENLEVAKLWIKYSNVEYVESIKNNEDEINNKIISGNKDKPIINEYILTFVKNKTNTEEIVCPLCGYQTDMLTTSKCIRCDGEIVSKKEHWVFVDKITTNISK